MLRSFSARSSDAPRLLRAQQIFNQNQEDVYVGNNKQAQRLWNFVTERGKYQDTYVVGPINPIYQSFALTCDILASVAVIAVQRDFKSLEDSFIRVVDGFPVIPIYSTIWDKLIEPLGIGRNKLDSSRQLGAAYYPLLANDFTRQILISEFNLVPDKPIANRPMYGGQIYRFNTKSDEMYFNLYEVMFGLVSVHRGMLDTLKTAQLSGVITDRQYERGYYNAVNGWQKYTGGSLLWTQIEGAVIYQSTLLTPMQVDTPETEFIMGDLRRQQELEAIK